LLETVRQYAHDRLVETADGDAARGRHVAVLSRTRRARPSGAPRLEQAAWLARLDLERENLLLAHSSCDNAPNGAESGLRLVYAIKPYWLNRGLLGIGTRSRSKPSPAVARKRAALPGAAASRTPASSDSFLSLRRGARAARREPCDRAGAPRQAAGRGRSPTLGWPASVAGTSPRRGAPTEALTLARELGNKRELARRSMHLHSSPDGGELDEAEPLYSDAVVIAARA